MISLKTRRDDAQYHYPGGPNQMVKVGHAGIANSARNTTVGWSFLAAFPCHGSAEAITLRTGFDDVRPIRQPIQHRLAKPGVGDLAGPFGKWKVRCHDDRRLLGASGDYLEEQFRSSIRHDDITEFVDKCSAEHLSTNRASCPCPRPVPSYSSKCSASDTSAVQR